MDIKREEGVREAIKYCIDSFDSETATNRIVEFWKDELELQTKQCNINDVSNSMFDWKKCTKKCKQVGKFGVNNNICMSLTENNKCEHDNNNCSAK